MPTAFRQALEHRLNRMAADQAVDVWRFRRQVAFDRLLARLFHSPEPPWILKGGYAMELRMGVARTTRDIDLTFTRRMETPATEATPEAIRRQLQLSLAENPLDPFEFLVGAPIQDLNAAPYGGARFPIEVRLAGRIFARFHLDVAAGDVVVEPVDELEGRDWLQFAGIARCRVRVISGEQQFAEKIHAYTLPRNERANSRVRDLIDMYLLVAAGLNPVHTRTCLAKTFDRRQPHTLPAQLVPPPEEWNRPFAVMARECDMSPEVEVAFQVVSEFFRSLTITD